MDLSFETLKNYKNDSFNNDVFFAMSHGVHRGKLKKGKFDDRENFINKILLKSPDVRFDLYGMNNRQPIWADGEGTSSWGLSGVFDVEGNGGCGKVIVGDADGI